jgi:hypothetical protein
MTTMALALALGVPPSERTSASAPVRPQASLTIEYWPHGNPGPGTRRWSLRCGPAGGSHPRPWAACAELARSRDPFAAPGRPCGRPIRKGSPAARVGGSYRGRQVQLIVRPGCGDAWTRLHTLLTGR